MRLGGQVEFEARIGSVPELVNEMCGHKLVRFVIAVTDRYINNNRYSQCTHWYMVNALGDTADSILVLNLHICDTINISGRWIIDENQNVAGNKDYKYGIIAEDVSMAKDSRARYEVA